MTPKANNVQPNNTIVVDAYADFDYISADNLHENYAFNNLVDSEVTSSDSTTDNSANVDNFDKFSISELQRRYNIKRHSLYARMMYLQIRACIVSGRAYLDAEQVRYMDELHDHIRSNNRMESYPTPEPSRPKRELEEPMGAIID